MPLWDIDFSDIDEDTEIPRGVGEEDKLPEGYSEEYAAIDDFVTENLLRAKESKDVEMVKFVVEQGVARYSRLGLKQAVLDKEIWLTRQLGKGILKGFQTKKRGEELQTQIQYMQELIADQKQKEVELRSRVAKLRAERDFKKARLEAVLRQNQGAMNEIDHIKKRIALTQERFRLDTIEYEKEKELRDDLAKTFTEYTEDLDRQLENAPWLLEKQKNAARQKELKDEIARLEADLAKIEMMEQRNKEIEESECELPFHQFCVQLAELYLKREKMAMQLEAEKQKVKRLEEQRRQRRALEDSSQMDSTQAILDADLDDEETLMRMAKHYKLDTQNLHPPVSQMTQDSQLPATTRTRAESPAESSASSEANETDMSDVGVEEQTPTKVVPPAVKRVSIVLPIANPDESVDEGTAVQMMKEKEGLNESQMDEDEHNGDRSQPEEMEVEEREEEEEEERREEEEGSQEKEKDGEQEEHEQMEQQESQPGSQESEMGSMVGGQMEEKEEEEEVDNEGFLRPADRSVMVAPTTQENEEHAEEAEASFNPEMMLNLSMHSNDPGNDFFDMMNNQATRKRAAADATGGSPVVGGSDGGDDGGFMNMFGGGSSGADGAAGDGDGASFSFNFGGGDANESNSGGGEFNFFGF